MSDELPALLGGPAVRPGGPPPWPTPDAAIADALRAAHADGSWGQYLGPHVAALEAALVRAHAVPHALTCASGTLAVEIALRALGVGPGDEVILGAYDFEPNFLTVHAVGARPVLVDVSAQNACIESKAVAGAVTPATRAILATHLHGGLVPMAELTAIAGRLGVPVVEDAAQAAGATVAGRPAGSWGDVGVLSFGGSKLLTAGRGGALLVREPTVFQKARLALTRGIQPWAPLSELQAAVLRPQLTELATRTDHRARRAGRLIALLQGIPGVRAFEPGVPESQTAYYKLGFFYDADAFGLPRDTFVKALRAEGIAFDAGFRALHVGRAPGRFRAAGPLSLAEAAGQTVVLLHHPVLAGSEADVEQVAVAVTKTYRNAARLR